MSTEAPKRTTIQLEEIIRRQEKYIVALEQEAAALRKRVEELERLLQEKAVAKEAKKPTFREDYSLSRQERKHRRRRQKKSTGRKPKEAKQAQIQRTERVYPEGAAPEDCELARDQCAWRLENGRAVYVRYEIFRQRDVADVPRILGLRNSRSEFGLEIHVVLAFLVYQVGVSIDHGREILRFFTGLDLSRSQADCLLNQLAADWEKDFESLCELVALAAVLYIDETGWKVGKRACYTWIFTTLSHVVFLCGKGRGGKVLDEILPQRFAGIGVTDNYSAYEHRFCKHQKCWAHLLRKIISLMLRFPEKMEYRHFFEQLYAIYRKAVESQKTPPGTLDRSLRAAWLQRRIRELCVRAGEKPSKAMPDDEQRFVKLQNELVGCIENLFVFVEHPEAQATNNASEQGLRGEAQARHAARTSKTDKGARRRSVITSVLGSLKRILPTFTFDTVLEEVTRWWKEGLSFFQRQLDESQAHAQLVIDPAPS
jgi:transposase